MSIVKTPRANQPISFFNKSNTAVALPNIYKTIPLDEEPKRSHKSGYLDTMAHLAENVDYEKK